MLPRSRIALISPGAADPNNGSWRTATRWQRMLLRRHAISIASDWTDDAAGTPPDLLIAIGAQRSAEALARFKAAHPDRPAIVVVGGADLDPSSPGAHVATRSLALASRLVVLNPDAIGALPMSSRAKAEAVMPSAPALRRRAPDPRSFDLVMVAHLRAVKDPQTAWRAFQRVVQRDQSMRFIHVGDALEPGFGDEATALMARYRGFRWLGPLSHTLARQQIRRARALVLPSVAEDGANVIVEAIMSGVPVLASAIPGNVGLLGKGYAGTFPPGDDVALANLIERIRHNRDFLAMLTRQCAERAPLFRPERERAQLSGLVASCLAPTSSRS